MKIFNPWGEPIAPADKTTSFVEKYSSFCPNLETWIPLALLASSRSTLDTTEYVITSTFALKGSTKLLQVNSFELHVISTYINMTDIGKVYSIVSLTTVSPFECN